MALPTTTSDPPRDPRIGRRRALRAGVGALAVGAGAASFASTAAAHFPERLDVDAVPGSDHNPVVSHGVVPVHVRTTAFEDGGETVVFDPTERPVRYRFGPAAAVSDGGGARPVHDGYPFGDGLLLCFRTAETGIDADTADVRLEWERTETGEHGLSGTDEVAVVGRGGPPGGAH